MSKDLFSGHADVYAKYRPSYPMELFDFIFGYVPEKKHAWDCATGNGQAAVVLADYFEHVDASDISETQVKNAEKKTNIQYHVFPAEHTSFPDDTFDLITVAQAYHWFSWKKFYDEATRTGKLNAVVAIWSYNLFFTEDKNVNQLIDHFYYEIIAPYWDPERKYVDDAYTTVEFEFKQLTSRDFDMKLEWTKDHFLGYLQSWSAVQHYIKKNKNSPLELVRKDLDSIWKNSESKVVHFPIFLKLGRVEK